MKLRTFWAVGGAHPYPQPLTCFVAYAHWIPQIHLWCDTYWPLPWRIWGRHRCTPPKAQNFLNFMQFFSKFGKIICWRPTPEVWRPLLREILVPPLLLMASIAAEPFYPRNCAVAPNVSKNYMELKEFGPLGGASKISLCRSATVVYKHWRGLKSRINSFSLHDVNSTLNMLTTLILKQYRLRIRFRSM